jgi:hypothetical protein
MVIRPIITYATTVWWPRVEHETSRARLSNLQRLQWPRITGAIKMAHTATIEVLLGLHPLHLKTEAEVQAGIYTQLQ